MPKIARGARLALWILVLGILAARAGFTIPYLIRAFAAPGPNTVGEAGKVYFASRIQDGRSPFADGGSPPYYPSVHGVLTHTSVGGIGWLLRASPNVLYQLGRLVSVLTTAVALVLLADLGRRLAIPAKWLAGGLLLWIGTYDLVAHTVSYRPDNWLLFLGALACWIVSVRPNGVVTFVVLALLPSLAFHVKSTGVAITGAIVASLALQGRARMGLALGGIQIAVLLLTIQMLNVCSDGSYVAGLQGIGRVPASAWNVLLVLVPDPVIPWILVLPVVWLRPLLRRDVERSSVLVPLLAFWGITGLVYGLAAARSGSNTYYFLEPATYGLLLVLARIGSRRALGTIDATVSVRPVALTLITAFLALPTALSLAVRGRGADVELYRTERLGRTRARLAERINKAGLYCYSDDPGLNVLLDKPAVIYPLLQMQMVEAATLPRETLLGPVERKEFDCVALSGVRWRYHGLLVPSESFVSAVKRAYPRSEFIGNYEVWFRSSERD